MLVKGDTSAYTLCEVYYFNVKHKKAKLVTTEGKMCLCIIDMHTYYHVYLYSYMLSINSKQNHI